jgi:hypothetical protein
MLASFGTWLAKLDPNVAVPIVLSVLAFLYHTLLSPTAQAKFASALNDAMELGQKAIDAALALAPAGTTAAQLEGDLLNMAKAQLQHAGLDPDKLPPVVTSLVQALVNVAVAKWKAAQPAPLKPEPQAVPVVVIPPPTPAGAAKGSARLALIVCIAAFGTTLAVGIGGATIVELEGCSRPQVAALGACATQAAQQTITVNGLTMTIADAVDNALATGNAETGIVVALATIASEIGMPYALDLIDCALDVIEGKLPAVTPADAGSGSASTAQAPLTKRQKIGIARAWTTAQRQALAQKAK